MYSVFGGNGRHMVRCHRLVYEDKRGLLQELRFSIPLSIRRNEAIRINLLGGR